jgi:hypothetical protein
MTIDLPPRVVATVVDETDADRRLDGATDLTAGVLAVSMTPPQQRAAYSSLLLTMLHRLGHNGVGARRKHTDLRHAAGYLRCAGITDLVVQHAQWLLPQGIDRLLRFADLTGVRPWLIVHHPLDQPLFDALSQHTDTSTWLDREELDTALTNRLRDRRMTVPSPWPTADDITVWPLVPEDDFVTFRAACRDQLDTSDFSVVDDRLRRDVTTFRADLSAAVTAAHRAEVPQRRAMLAHAIQEALAPKITASVDINEAVVVMRALQIAAFQLGVFVQANLRTYTSDAFSRCPRPDALARLPWHRLVAYQTPHRPAVVALRACGLTAEQVCRLEADAVASDGGTVTVDGEPRQVPAHARPFLRVARLHATYFAPRHRRLLFDGNDPLTPRGVETIERGVAAATGFRLPPVARPAASDPEQWMADIGLRLRSLT